MAKYKYMEFTTPEGVVERGSVVRAFCPMEDGKRSVVIADVVGINKNTIRVSYVCKGKTYETIVGPRYFCI